jgi:predicted DCC family thiol-disulfide oxidoreductase YuxK
MNRPLISLIRLFTLIMVLGVAITPASAETVKPKPEVWMGPPGYDNGRHFRELFEKPDEWKETRALVDVLFYADHNFKRHFNDDELRKWFGQLNQWRLKLAMEVGAVKPWGQTGEKCFAVEKPNWDRLQNLGANLYAIAMDEPLLCCRLHIKKPDDYAVQETANYIALVRKHFPQMKIGDIETYPSIPLADHIWWIESLQKKLAEMGVRGLDFYRLDVNWANFVVQNHGCWKEVKKLESYCRSKKLPFSMIYWASGEPLLKKLGVADESTWYIEIMAQGYAYAMNQGAPDQVVIESWLQAPSRCLPETADWTFTRSVRDFCRRFVRTGK